MSTSKNRNSIALLVFGTIMATQTGCVTLSALIGRPKGSTLDTTMLEAQGYSIPPGGMPAITQLDPSAGPRIVLEVRGEGTHLETIPLPTDRATFVEDLVQQAKLAEQIGPLTVSIMRPNGSGPPIRLDAKTDRKGKTLNVGLNYALLPGDHLIVYSDNRSLLEKFIDKQLH